jgi:hypothetical protein
VLQFEPMRKLVKIFNKHGIRGSFNAEVMQQLTDQSQQGRFPELKALADEWEQVVLESFRQGHDIQLHLHPQWFGASYQGHGNWNLGGNWSILNYPCQQIRAMLVAGKQYLETLLQPDRPNLFLCVVPGRILVRSPFRFLGVHSQRPRLCLRHEHRRRHPLRYVASKARLRST